MGGGGKSNNQRRAIVCVVEQQAKQRLTPVRPIRRSKFWFSSLFRRSVVIFRKRFRVPRRNRFPLVRHIL